MREADTDLVQKQLSELAQQVAHIIPACNEENDILEDKFDSQKNGILIMESCLQTEKVRIDAEVAGVGSMMHFQEVILPQLRSGIHILPNQDNQIVVEATDLFTGIHREQEAMSKRISDNTLQILAVKASN